MDQLDQLVAQAGADFAAAADSAALETAKARFLGKGGSITELLKGLGKLDAKSEITEDVLVAAGLTNHKRDGIRILGKGTIKTAVKLNVTGASASAIEAVAAAGGTLTVKPARVAAE